MTLPLFRDLLLFAQPTTFSTKSLTMSTSKQQVSLAALSPARSR